jgi:branched-chain amino acid aminotransferase
MTGQEQAANPFAAGCAWIDGRYLPVGEARIPILDTGFVRSDLTYDVVAVWEGRFFRLDDHLDRLFAGCRRIRLTPPLTQPDIREILIGTVQRSGLREAYVEAIVTRGVPEPGVRDPRRLTPRVYAYAIPYVWIVPSERQPRGTDVVITRGTRRIPPAAVDPTVKNFHWGDLTRGLFEAYDRGASLPILPGEDGLVTEGPGFNVFACVDGRWLTPASGTLAGVTRRSVIELAREAGEVVEEGTLSTGDLRRAAEVLITSTAGGIMPVTLIDGQPVGTGTPGPRTALLRDRYWARHEDPRFSTPVRYDGHG